MAVSGSPCPYSEVTAALALLKGSHELLLPRVRQSLPLVHGLHQLGNLGPDQWHCRTLTIAYSMYVWSVAGQEVLHTGKTNGVPLTHVKEVGTPSAQRRQIGAEDRTGIAKCLGSDCPC